MSEPKFEGQNLEGAPELSERNREMLRLLNLMSGLLKSEGIDYWVVGGWGIDGYLGRVSREHHDMDVLTWQKDREKIEELLKDRNINFYSGWEDEDGKFHDYVNKILVKKTDGVDVDIVFLDQDDKNKTVFLHKAKKAKFPKEFLDGKEVLLQVGDENSKFMVPAPELLIASKIMSKRPKDIEDRTALMGVADSSALGKAQKYPFDRESLNNLESESV